MNLITKCPPPTPPGMAGGVLVCARARACIGARFRLHGRDPATGLDCVGLAAVATGIEAPRGYAMRGGDAADVARRMDAVLERVDRPQAGDLVLAEAGPGQFHMVVMTARGFVHADAGLRRVVERPGALPWPVTGIWRKG